MEAEPIRRHQGRFDASRATGLPFRDAALPQEDKVHVDNSPVNYVNEANQSGVAVYQRAGWFDMYPRDMLLWHADHQALTRGRLISAASSSACVLRVRGAFVRPGLSSRVSSAGATRGPGRAARQGPRSTAGPGCSPQ